MAARALGIGIAALILLTLVPSADAVVSPPGSPPRDGVVSWFAGSWTTNTWCGASDPAVGLVATSAGSYVEYAFAGAGKWRYTVHLTQLAPATGCPANIDFSFTAAMAPWPTVRTSVPVTLCGGLGTIDVYPSEQGVFFWLSASFPASCGAGITGSWSVAADVKPLHPSLLSVCSPVGVVNGASCVGPYEHQDGATCPSGSRQGGTVIGVTSVHRECHDGERVVFYPTAGLLVRFEFTRSSCTMYVQDPLVGVVDVTAGCPGQLSGPFWGSQWGQMLP